MIKLSDLKNTHNENVLQRVQKKLNILFDGKILPKETNKYLNLSNHQLSNEERNVLNLGLNFHIQPNYDKLKKKTEIEILYQQLQTLERSNKVLFNEGLKEQLISESAKHRNTRRFNSILTKEMREAAKQLKENKNIIIRKADKSNTYVILNKDIYENKLNKIVNDDTKFEKITRDPTSTLKTKLNGLIESINAVQSDIKLSKLVGNYTPAYIYGNPKIHKNKTDPNLRPIISQIPSPIYKTAHEML